MLLLSILPPIVLSFLLIDLLWSGTAPSIVALKACVLPGLSAGTSSLLLFIGLAVFEGNRWAYILTEAILTVLSLGALAFLRLKVSKASGNTPLPHQRTETRHPAILLLYILLATAFVSVLVHYALLTARYPHGSWDAWAVWNLRARSLARGGFHWADAFSTHYSPSHPDYPVLLPATIARTWLYLGNEPTWVPCSLALAFTFGAILLVTSTVAASCGIGRGCLAGLVLCTCSSLPEHGIQQYADVPLLYFILLTIALVTWHDACSPQPGLLALAGLAAGFALWTKNEGALFLLCFIISRLIILLIFSTWKEAYRQLTALTIGLLPPLLVTIWFKLQYAPQNDLLSAQSPEQIFRTMTDISRHMVILKATTQYLKHIPIPLVAFFALSLSLWGFTRQRRIIVPVLSTVGCVILMSAGYYVVYLTTPSPLGWHLSTSLGRLLTHLYPPVILAYFLGLGNPREI